MEILPIFADRLYAFKYNLKDESDEFEHLFDIWQDVIYLEEFFTSNQRDLQSGFFQPVPTIEQAISFTREEARRLENRLIELSEAASIGFNEFFRPLSEHEDSYPLPRFKGYGLNHKSWLRIYALKIGHRYYVTGGAIKLTKNMIDRPHTEEQLRKLQRCQSFFQEKGITDIEGAKELDL